MGKAVEGLEVAKTKSGRLKGVNKGEELRRRRVKVYSGCYFIGPFASLWWALLYRSICEFVVGVTLLVLS